MTPDLPLLFAEGMLAFISPCILPMLPVYLAYLSADDGRAPLLNTAAFVAGFSIVFMAMGAAASAVGIALAAHRAALERAGGAVMVLFGLHFAGVLRVAWFDAQIRADIPSCGRGVLGAFVFGCAFSFGWTPCLGPLLASALMLAGNAETVRRGVFCLFVFSMGLGVPYMISAAFLSKLRGVFGVFKNHGAAVRRFSGLLLIAAGAAIASGNFGYWQGLFYF